MMELESSVFASGYEAFQIIQYIEQLTYQIFRGDTLFIEDFFHFFKSIANFLMNEIQKKLQHQHITCTVIELLQNMMPNGVLTCGPVNT